MCSALWERKTSMHDDFEGACLCTDEFRNFCIFASYLGTEDKTKDIKSEFYHTYCLLIRCAIHSSSWSNFLMLHYTLQRHHIRVYFVQFAACRACYEATLQNLKVDPGKQRPSVCAQSSKHWKAKSRRSCNCSISLSGIDSTSCNLLLDHAKTCGDDHRSSRRKRGRPARAALHAEGKDEESHADL
jgi:hypothetical protein